MAHIVCSAKKVRDAAQAVIRSIEDTRTKHDEKAIACVMENERVHWWKFWQPAGMTREQAIKWLDASDASDMWGWRSYHGWGDLSKANKLLILAKHGDPVTLDEESAKVLWG